MPNLIRKNFTLLQTEIAKYEQCPAAGAYRVDGKRRMSFPAWYGIFVGRFIQYATTRGRAAALKYIHTKKMKGVIRCCENIDTDALPIGPTEVPYAHNVLEDTARPLGVGDSPRELDVSAEQYGRADVIAERDGVPFVVDYKTGDIEKRNPAESTQLLGLAASVRGSLDPSKPKPDRYFIGFAGVLGTGDVNWAVCSIGDSHIDQYVERARQIHLRVLQDRERLDAGKEIDWVRGEECRFCDLKSICPAHK